MLVLYAGGTVGCAGVPLAPMAGADFAALLAGRGWLGPDDRFEALATPLDSASMQPADWLRIAGLLLEHWSDFDAFIVLHGTDTLAWTAAALSYLLAGQDKPVVLTGSQRPLVAEDSDAARNVADAIRVARSGRLHEVAVCFAGRILRGNRCSKRSAQQDDAFHSPRWRQLGAVYADTIDWQTGAGLPAPSTAFDPVRQQALLARIAAGAADVRVAMLTLHPGMPAELLHAVAQLPQARKGCVLQCFGAGNAPEEPAFVAALQDLAAASVAMLAITQAPHGEVRHSPYQSATALQAAGVVEGGDLGPEAAHAKLWLALALALQGAALRTYLTTDLAGELTGTD
ncbi:asparaginase [Viridibacterium curvum]|uniref:asparaginase n=1 Tax=Viridibacterium curvum TaxID=1101404 RepID=UPI0031E550F2